jgi:hypothetical protein
VSRKRVRGNAGCVEGTWRGGLFLPGAPLIVRMDAARGVQAKVPEAVALRSRAGASEACIALGRRSKSTENGLWDAGSFAGDAENQGARAMVDKIVSIARRVGDSLILGRCFCFAGFGGQVSD